MRARDLQRVPEEGQAPRAGRERAVFPPPLLDLGQPIQREEERQAEEELEQHLGGVAGVAYTACLSYILLDHWQ